MTASLAFAGPALADVTEVSGGAFGESISLTGIPIVGDITSAPRPEVSFTNPSDGDGPFTDSLASTTQVGTLTTGVLNVSTEGGNLGSHSGFAKSSADVTNVDIGAGRITADVVASECTSNGDGSSGSSTLTTATVDGNAVPVNPPANTVIALAGGIGSVTLNEQIRPTDGAGDTSIVVNAIHVRLTGGALGTGDIIVAQSRCGARGPDVVPVAPLGLLGITGLLGIGFAGMQWKKRRHTQAVATSTN